MGVSDSHLTRNLKYTGRYTAEFIKDSLLPSLRDALTQFGASNLYAEVEHIKIIVKQLQGYNQVRLDRKAAGALTECTVTAMEILCDESAGANSRLSVEHGKHGWYYIRTLLPSERKLHLLRSTGKHTNAILAFLEWSKEHLPQFVKHRLLHMDISEN